MGKSQQTERAAGLLERLYGSGAISRGSTDALLATGLAAPQIENGLGKTASSNELLLASVLVDDSPSIASSIEEIRFGHSLMLEALGSESGASTDVHVLTSALNRGVISPYTEIERALTLNDRNFNQGNLGSGTPLYRQTVVTLGTVLAKSQEVEERGGAVRTFTLLITDGADNASDPVTAAHARTLIDDMLNFSSNHIVAGMGVGTSADFRKVFMSMCIPSNWIFTPGSSVDDLKEVFRKIARSLQIAAASESGFLQLVAGPDSDDG